MGEGKWDEGSLCFLIFGERFDLMQKAKIKDFFLVRANSAIFDQGNFLWFFFSSINETEKILYFN